MDAVVVEKKESNEDNLAELRHNSLRNDDNSHFVFKSRETSYFKDNPKNAVLNGFSLSAREKFKNDNYDLYQSIIKTKVDDLYNRAKEAFETKEYTKCLSILSKSFYFEADNVDYYSLAGDCYWNLKDYKEASMIYKKVCILKPEFQEDFRLKIAGTYTKQADEYFDNGNYLEALDNYVRASEVDPLDERNTDQSINCLIALNRQQDCLNFINQHLEKETDNTRLLLSRARLHLTFNKPTLCYYDIKEALILNPECEESKKFQEERRNLAEELKQEAEDHDLNGNIDQAIFKISKAIAVFPSIAEYYLLRGSMHRRNNTFNAAVDDLSKAMDTVNYESKNETFKFAQKQLLLTFNDFAVYCFQKGYYEEAIVLLEKAIQAEKENKYLYLNRGDCFLKLRHLHFALLDYQQAEELDPYETSISLRLSTVYSKLGKLEYKDKKYYKAENYFSLAIAYDPKVASYYVMRAKSRYMMDMITETEVDAISVLFLDPSNREISGLFSRLFSGKTVDQVLQGDYGQSVITALRTELDEVGCDLERKASFSPKKPLPGITENRITSQLKKCLEDQEFHHSIIEERKTMDEMVDLTIQFKQDLSYTGPRKTRKIKSIKFTTKSNCIKRGSCHIINIEGNVGIFKVTDMTKENKITYIHGSIFMRPEHLENEQSISFGEHEVVKATRPLSLPLCCFKDLLTDLKPENFPTLPGVQSYKHEELKITDIESKGYLKLKNPTSRILDNISASLEMKSILEKATDKVRFRRYENKSINDDGSRKTNDAPTIDILNYRDYCRIRKLKAGLEAGLLIHEDKLKAERLISSAPKYFMFSEMFIPDRQIQKWCRKNEMQINLDFKQKAIQKRKQDSISHQDEIDDNMFKRFYDAPVISEYKLTKVKYERTRLKKRKIID